MLTTSHDITVTVRNGVNKTHHSSFWCQIAKMPHAPPKLREVTETAVARGRRGGGQLIRSMEVTAIWVLGIE